MSRDAINKVIDQLTMVIRAHDGRAELLLNWNVYDISINCEF